MGNVFKQSNTNVQHFLFNPGWWHLTPTTDFTRENKKLSNDKFSNNLQEWFSVFLSPVVWSSSRFAASWLDLDLTQDSRPSSYFPATMTNWEVDTHFSRLRKHQDSNLPGASDWSHVPVLVLSLAYVLSPQDNVTFPVLDLPLICFQHFRLPSDCFQSSCVAASFSTPIKEI